MNILNTKLLNPRDIFFIAVVSIAIHVIAAPLFRMVDGIPDND